MGLGTCSHCWDNPCTCGHAYLPLAAEGSSYKDSNRDMRMKIAAAALGVTKEFLEQSIGASISDKHPYEVVRLLKELERYPNIERYVVDPKHPKMVNYTQHNHPLASEPYLIIEANPMIDWMNSDREEEIALLNFAHKVVDALQRYIPAPEDVEEDVDYQLELNKALAAMKAAGYEIFRHPPRQRTRDDFWLVRLPKFAFQFA